MTATNVLDVLGDWAGLDGPLYRRLASAIRSAVEDGRLPAGHALPPERAMARELAVGRSTVVAAYDLLRDEELLESRQGSGTWVCGAARLPRSGSRESLPGATPDAAERVVDLATAALPAAGLLHTMLDELTAESVAPLLGQLGYAPHGLAALRTAVAEMLTRDGLPTEVHQVLVTTGDQQALSLLTEHLLQQGDVAVVEDPTSAGMLDLLRARPVTVRAAPAIALAGAAPLLEVADKAQPALTYLMPSPAVTGALASPIELDHLRRLTALVPGLVVEDTGSRLLALVPPAPLLAASAADPDRIVTVGSMSKLFWGGLRVGWIRASTGLIDRLGRIKTRADLGTPLLSQHLAAQLLPRLDDVRRVRLEELHLTLDDAERLLARHLPEFGWERPQAGLTVWLRMPSGTSAPFAELAHRHGVAVVPGAALSAVGGADDRLRLTYARPADVVEEGLRRLATAWREYRSSLTRGQSGDDPYFV